MSNPGVFLLDEGIVNNKTVRIEDNLGEAIHIHIDDIRLSLTVNDFYALCEEIEKATKELFHLEGLEWNRIDKTSLDWEWLADYENLLSIGKKEVKLGDLYTVNIISAEDNVSRIVKIKDSNLVNILNGKESAAKKLTEKNMYQVTSISRLNNILNIIRTRGYPYDDKYIMIDENNRIYDGDHRAACLFFLYGGDISISVLELKNKSSVSFKHVVEENRKLVVKYIIKKLLKRIIELPKKLKQKFLAKKVCENEKVNRTVCRISTLLGMLDEKAIKYYRIDKKIVNDGVDVTTTLIVKDFEKIKAILGDSEKKVYDNYAFLYSTPRPIFLKLLDGNIAIWDRLTCKSAFENAILPLDKKINDYMWNVVEVTNDHKYIKEIPIMLYVISNCILEKCKFEYDDIEFIESNKKLLENAEFKVMLEGIFFNYSNVLLKCLLQRNYRDAVIGYKIYRKY